jgi:glycosyltransferase 2 family protein
VNKIIRIVVSATLLAWLGWRMDWRQIGATLTHIRMGYWWAAVGLYLLTQGISSLRWQLLSRPLGFERPLSDYTRFYFIGMFFNLFLPTSVGGDVIRAYLLRTENTGKLNAFLSVLVDRGSGLLVLLCLGLAGIWASPVPLPAHLRNAVFVVTAVAFAAMAGAAILSKVSKRLERVQRLMDGLSVYARKPALLASTTGVSLLVQAANVAVVYLAGLALGLDVPPGYYVVAVPMVTLLTLVPITLNGLGIREGGMIVFLAPVGVEAAQAVSLAWLWFMVFTAASLVGGLVYLLGDFSRPKEISHDAVVGDHSDQGRTRQSRAAA